MALHVHGGWGTVASFPHSEGFDLAELCGDTMTVLALSTGTPTELDPKPWVDPQGGRWPRRAVTDEHLKPRPQYSQDLSAYENGTQR